MNTLLYRIIISSDGPVALSISIPSSFIGHNYPNENASEVVSPDK